MLEKTKNCNAGENRNAKVRVKIWDRDDYKARTPQAKFMRKYSELASKLKQWIKGTDENFERFIRDCTNYGEVAA